MHVALYHPWVYLKGGIERTILEITKRSRHKWTVLTSRYDPDGTFPELKKAKVVKLAHLSAKRSYSAVIKAACSIALTRLDLRSFDVLVICCDGLGDLMTLRNAGRPILCLCFTPLRAVFDADYRRRLLAGRGLYRPIAVALESGFRGIDRLCWRRYAAVVAISNTVRERIVDGRLYPAERVQVLHPGIEVDKIAPAHYSERFFLIAGRIMWTKNIELGLEAFRRARKQLGMDFQLVISGMVDAKSRSYLEWLRKSANEIGGVRFVINPSDPELRELYERCAALIFPVFNEDWGLVPLEAMMAGKPVIAVNKGGPRETVVDGETGFLEPDDPDSFARRMVQLAADPGLARRLGYAGSERARVFGWAPFVAGLDDAIERLVTSTAGDGRTRSSRIQL